MGKANCRVRFVYMLSALSACTVGIYTKIFRFNVYFDYIIQNRIHIYRSKAGVTSRVCIKRRDSYKTMDSPLTL